MCMGRNLLFISKYPEIVKEFLEAMEGKQIEIDTASNGIEAAAKIKKREYQVIVTGLSLDGYNGEQIITYLNKSFPDTVCIIYTTTISPAQLHFFINERKVFRVFLRPVDFAGDFFLALEEAYEHYDICVKNKEEEREKKEEYKQKKSEMEMLARKLDAQRRLQEIMNRYMKRLLYFTLQEYAGAMDDKRRDQLRQLEWEIVDLFCEQSKDSSSNRLIEAEEIMGKIKALSEG